MARFRGGCFNCRQRRRRCDQQRPSCAACLRRHVECSGYPAIHRWINHAAEASIQPVHAALDNSGPVSSQLPPAAQSSMMIPASPPMYESRTTQLLFRKFLNSGLMLLYKTQQHSWIQPFFINMSAESQSFAIMSAALQTYIDQGEACPSIPTLECVDIALKTFRLEVASYRGGFPSGTICSGILLCRPYTQCLRMMAHMYHLTNPTLILVPSPEKDLTVRHAIEYLAVADLPYLVLGRVCSSLCIWKRYREAQDDWEGGRVMGIDAFTGLHMGLLDIFGDMMHDNVDHSVTRLWEWPSETDDFMQRHLWDAWRFAGIIDARRRERCRAKDQDTAVGGASTRVPVTSSLLGILMGTIHSVYACSLLPENRHLLALNGLIYPLIVASLEVPSLKQHPEWKRTLDDVRRRFEMGRTYALSRLTFQLLDEAWEEGSSCFDIDHAARSKGVELAVM
ncbi:hypothetical protein DER44DRAFT_654183 [Fusarium oxysporum]|nr:hypothetical protein DER44DRAFT_654183 [Fusarium oxysporum]